MDFNDAETTQPAQVVTLQEDFKGVLDYPMKVGKFNNVNNVTLFIENNYGAPRTRIYYLAFKGTFTAVSCLYNTKSDCVGQA